MEFTTQFWLIEYLCVYLNTDTGSCQHEMDKKQQILTILALLLDHFDIQKLTQLHQLLAVIAVNNRIMLRQRFVGELIHAAIGNNF